MKYLKLFEEFEDIHSPSDSSDLNLIKDLFQEYVDEFGLEKSKLQFSKKGIFYNFERVYGMVFNGKFDWDVAVVLYYRGSEFEDSYYKMLSEISSNFVERLRNAKYEVLFIDGSKNGSIISNIIIKYT